MSTKGSTAIERSASSTVPAPAAFGSPLPVLDQKNSATRTATPMNVPRAISRGSRLADLDTGGGATFVEEMPLTSSVLRLSSSRRTSSAEA